MTCFTEHCTSPGTVPVQVSASTHKGDEAGSVTVMFCEECAFPYSAGDVVGAAMMGDV